MLSLVARIDKYASDKDKAFRSAWKNPNRKPKGYHFDREVFVEHSDSSIFLLQNAQVETTSTSRFNKKTHIRFAIIYAEHHKPLVFEMSDLIQLKVSKPKEQPVFIKLRRLKNILKRFPYAD